MRWRSGLNGLAAALFVCVQAAGAGPVPPPEHATFVSGTLERVDDDWQVISDSAWLRIGQEGGADYIASMEVVFSEGRAVRTVVVAPRDAEEPDGPALLRQTIRGDESGRLLQMRQRQWDAQRDRWVNGDLRQTVRFWPRERGTSILERLAADGIAPRTWHERTLALRADVRGAHAAVWLQGRLLERVASDSPIRGPVLLQLREGDRLRAVRVTDAPHDSRFELMDLTALANDAGLERPTDEGPRTIAGVPFILSRGERDHLSLRRARWIDQLEDPQAFYAQYDRGAPILNDPRMPMLRVPRADYVAMHVLAVADEDDGAVPRFTVRAGRYGPGGLDQVVQHEFVGHVPTEAPSDDMPLHHVRVPMSLAFAQDLASDWMDMELTRDVRLAVRRPDPNRFQHRPLGLPSGVRIAAITLERSPLQMSVTSDETGHAFNEPQVPTFHVRLENITDQTQAFTLEAIATHLDGEEVSHQKQGEARPGASARLNVPLPVARGYHDVAITLRDGSGEHLLTRRTAMALLPEDTRQHRDHSPFGTWNFGGTHFTAHDLDVVGPLYVKLGMRLGLFGGSQEQMERYGLWHGNEPNAHRGSEYLQRWFERRSDRVLPYAQVFHENSISGPHSTRVPDLFHDGPRYELNEREQERFENMWEQATEPIAEVRDAFPHLHLRFGNGPAPMREEFFRRGLPSEKFDSAGNESASFGRMPESQPPDWIAINAGLWMDRQMLDAYGYPDKPVTLGYEVIYPSTNPGNLSYRTQADYMVRHALHALAWEMEHIRPGLITDVGSSYRFGNWGASGFARSRPEYSVKPAFVAFATMTWVLDGAEFARVHDAGSRSVHLVEFDRPDGGKVFALWTIRGTRPLTLRFDDSGRVRLINDQGRKTTLGEVTDHVTVESAPTPVYVVADRGELAEIVPGEPDHSDAAAADEFELVHALDSLDDWRVIDEPNALLDHYNPMTPRRKGAFAFERVREHAERSNVIRVTPERLDHGKPTMPMYVELEHVGGLPLDGEPTDIAVVVHGNSGWGRLIFELTDASGQTWTSIGAAHRGDISPWLRDWMPEDAVSAYESAGRADWNTDDLFGYSRINFDGWRHVVMPLPGHYPGETGWRYHWPRTSQWRYDGDGEVHYPLTLRKVIVELNEKTLHMTEFAPAPEPSIHLGPIKARYGTPPAPRNANRGIADDVLTR